MKKKEVHFSFIGNPNVILTSARRNDLCKEGKVIFGYFVDIIVDEFPIKLPPSWSIKYHMALILRANLPKKELYSMNHQENEEMYK